MNRNREQIEEKIAEIMKQEKELSVKINLDPEAILDNKQNVIFYGGFIGSIEIGKYLVEIRADGDVYVDLYRDGKWEKRIKDRANVGCFGRETEDFIHSDEEYEALASYDYVDEETLNEKKNVLYVEDHNWLEVFFFIRDETGGYDEVCVGGDLTGCVLDADDVLEGFDAIQSYIDMIQEYEQEGNIA